jgi:Reactive mitochondrial oxygen species modulator 1
VHQLRCSLARALTLRNTAAARATPARTMSVFDERCMKRVGAGATVGAAVGGAVGVQQPLPAPCSLLSACWCLQVLCMAPTRRSPTRWAPRCCLIPLPWRGVLCGCLGPRSGSLSALLTLLLLAQVPGLLKVRYIGKTTTQSAALFGLFLAAGSLLQCGKQRR